MIIFDLRSDTASGGHSTGMEKIKAYVLELNLEQSISEAAIDNRHPIKDWVTRYEGSTGCGGIG